MKWIIPMALILVGCNPATDSAPADGVFEGQKQALEKVRAVGDQLNDAAARQREQIEAATEQ